MKLETAEQQTVRRLPECGGTHVICSVIVGDARIAAEVQQQHYNAWINNTPKPECRGPAFSSLPPSKPEISREVNNERPTWLC